VQRRLRSRCGIRVVDDGCCLFHDVDGGRSGPAVAGRGGRRVLGCVRRLRRRASVVLSHRRRRRVLAGLWGRWCEAQGESAKGTTVHCTFDYHVHRSDEIAGRGPYSGNSYSDIVVRDGKITSAAATWDVFGSGSSNEMWTPLQAWVTRTHPEDLLIMYPVGDPDITDEYIRVWDQNTREFAAAVNAGTAE
jgi:hypothetical protein